MKRSAACHRVTLANCRISRRYMEQSCTLYVDGSPKRETTVKKHIPPNAKKKKEKLEPTQWNLGSQKKAVCDGCVLQNSVQKRQLSMREYWKMFVVNDCVVSLTGRKRDAFGLLDREKALIKVELCRFQC